MFAFAPEWGWTFACSAPNSSHARCRGELLGLVDDEVAAVVPLGRIALRVLVGEHRALRLEHGARREVLRRDQLDRRVLPLDLTADDVGDDRVGLLERAAHHTSSPASIAAISAEPRDVAAALERGLEEDLQDLLGERRRDDAAAHRQHVGVVVEAREPSREQVVAQRGADAAHLVRGDLLALPAPTEHDADVGVRRRRRRVPTPAQIGG